MQTNIDENEAAEAWPRLAGSAAAVELPGIDEAAEAPPQPEGGAVTMALGGIVHPGQNDVKFGRGGDTNYHIGNTRFRHFCLSYKKKYKTASKEGRQAVVQEIVDDWRAQNPPGRFLARTNPAAKEISKWHDVGDEIAFKKTVKVLGEGLGVKRRKKKDDTSAAQQDPDSEKQAISRRPGDVFEAAAVHGDARVADDASSAKHVGMGRRASSASSDSSRSSGASSPLWEVEGDLVSATLRYGQGRAVDTMTKSPAGRGAQAFGRRALGTLNSTTLGQARFATFNTARHAGFLNTSSAGRQTSPTQSTPTSDEMPWTAALGTQLPVAASLTGVFGTNGVESGSDSGDDGKVKAASRKRTTR